MGLLSDIGHTLFGGTENYNHFERALQLSKLSLRLPKHLGLEGPGRVRRYEGANFTNTQSDWQAWLTSGSYEILHGSRVMRARARDLERNNPHVVSFIRELDNNILGCAGVRFYSRVPMQKGPNLNKKLNLAVQEAWTDYRRKENFEVRKKWTGLECDRMILRRLFIDGEVLLFLVRGYDNEHRFAVQMLECDSLDIFYNQDVGNNQRVVMGVQMDLWGKPTGYHLLDYPQTSAFAENVPMRRQFVAARDLVHIYLPDRMSSVRGITALASSMTKLRTLERYEEAVAIANRLGAAKMGYLESDQDAENYTGQGQTPSGETIEEISPGLIVDLPPGKRFTPFDPKGGPQTYGDFRKNILRSIASGLGIMYNTLSSDLESINYSSARFSKDQEIETWRHLQGFFAEHYLQDVFSAWLPCAILADQIPGASMMQTEIIGKSTRWAGRGWPFVDPEKEVASTLNAIDGGLTTRRRELEERGLILEEVYDELAEEQELQEEKGLIFTNPANKNPQQPTTENPQAPSANGANGEVAAPAEEDEEEEPAPAKRPTAKKPAPKRK